jgi:predicted DNA-binding protein (UPF0251 family)
MKPRGRPKKFRVVRKDPKISQFSPRGRPGRPDEAVLAMDEFEAVRLAYYLGFSQKEAARSMKISQQTFSRILRRANKAIADVIVNGKIIKIQGGAYVMNSRQDPVQNLPNKPREVALKSFKKPKSQA